MPGGETWTLTSRGPHCNHNIEMCIIPCSAQVTAAIYLVSRFIAPSKVFLSPESDKQRNKYRLSIFLSLFSIQVLSFPPSQLQRKYPLPNSAQQDVQTINQAFKNYNKKTIEK
jgi:hypothetical protein